MRVSALILLGIVLAVSSPADAEKVKTNQQTKVYSRPGEHGTVLLKVKSGQNMTVLSKEGRWLKVRVQGRTGYVPRSKVDMPDGDEIVRNTRRRPFVDGRSTKRGFAGDQGPDDRVGADATGDVAQSGDGDDDDKGDKGDKGDDDDDSGSKKKASSSKKKSGGDDDDADSDDDDGGGKKKVASSKKKGGDDDDDAEPDDSKTDEPSDDDRPRAHVSSKTKVLAERDKDSDTQFVAKPGETLYPEEQKGKWTFVSNEDGDAGWILTSSLEDDGGGGGHGKRTIDVRARLGLTFIQQGMRSVGSTFTGTGFNPDNYNLGTSALTLALAGSYYRPYGKDYVLGADLSYTYAKTVFGGVFADPDGPGGMPGVNIGMALHQLDLRAAVGKDLHKPSGMTIFGRLGYRYQGFLIDDVTNTAKNPAKLPSEVFQAPTIGAMLAMPHLTDKLGLRVALDAAVFGTSVTQTKGYEDGVSPSAKAACLGVVFTYKWKKDMDLQGSYDFDYESIDFGKPTAMNLRGHTGTDVSRSDFFHIVSFGVVKGF
ncbi:MAG TPA: SH3 domain-containing protein [Kofleriaceae bacterium]|nr:SH3 domain-containing protein [Kofleriaceae bacterium]